MSGSIPKAGSKVLPPTKFITPQPLPQPGAPWPNIRSRHEELPTVYSPMPMPPMNSLNNTSIPTTTGISSSTTTVASSQPSPLGFTSPSPSPSPSPQPSPSYFVSPPPQAPAAPKSSALGMKAILPKVSQYELLEKLEKKGADLGVKELDILYEKRGEKIADLKDELKKNPDNKVILDKIELLEKEQETTYVNMIARSDYQEYLADKNSTPVDTTKEAIEDMDDLLASLASLPPPSLENHEPSSQLVSQQQSQEQVEKEKIEKEKLKNILALKLKEDELNKEGYRSESISYKLVENSMKKRNKPFLDMLEIINALGPRAAIHWPLYKTENLKFVNKKDSKDFVTVRFFIIRTQRKNKPEKLYFVPDTTTTSENLKNKDAEFGYIKGRRRKFGCEALDSVILESIKMDGKKYMLQNPKTSTNSKSKHSFLDLKN